MRFLSIAEGLSHQTVNCFCQDEFGFVWIGTQDGLNRFDGRTVDRFQLDGTPGSISSNNIRQLYSDRNGHIFIRSLQCVERYDLRLERFDLLYNGDVSAMACIGGEIYLVDNERILRIDGTLPAGEQPQPETLFSFADFGEHPGSINNLVVAGDRLILSSSKLGLLCIADGRIVQRKQGRNRQFAARRYRGEPLDRNAGDRPVPHRPVVAHDMVPTSQRRRKLVDTQQCAGRRTS